MFKTSIDNLLSGLRLMLGLPVARQHFRVSLVFMLLALITSIGLLAAIDYLQLDYIRYQDIRGTALLGSFLAVGLLLAIITAHLEKDYPQLPVLMTVVLSCLPWSALLLSLFPYTWISVNQAGWLLTLLLGYFAFVIIRCQRVAYYRPHTSTLIMTLVALVVVSTFSWQHFYFPTLFDSYNPDEYTQDASVDAEHTFYQQQRLVDEKLRPIKPSRAGVTDYFFLGFGGSDRQTVFESETQFAKNMINTLYQTSDRSLVLYNNADNLDSQPLANTYNLAQAVSGLASRMNSDEDVLIMLLTSHGGDNATLAVELESVELKMLGAQDLKESLDQAQIKWRIIIISACYAGSFIDTLEDENTLIITAASAQRNSFGCSSDRELTVFGEAYFKYALKENSNWVTAFVEARDLIAQWEHEAGVTPSEPQISLGHNIRLKLGLPLPPAPAVSPQETEK